MYRITIFLFLILNASIALADTVKHLSFQTSSIQIEKSAEPHNSTFTKVSVHGLENDKTLGAPGLPMQSWLVRGRPQDIHVTVKNLKEEVIENTRPFPTQDQDCRCKVAVKPRFQYQARLYRESHKPYRLTYLGAFRGTPVSRLDVALAKYEDKKNRVIFKTEMEVVHDAPEFSFEAGDYKDYLIVVPEDLEEGIQEFVQWKKDQGYNVVVETFKTTPNAADLTAMIRKSYTEAGTDFVILIGDEQKIPMFKLRTSGSPQTPSDLKYFTMDGADDFIPDVFSSRIVASSADQLAAQFAKIIEFEKKSFRNSEGLKKVIGIASNEGYDPSDAQYIQSINEKFKTVLGVNSVFLGQNDSANSNPTVLNRNFSEGAVWLTYMGHGSGTEWVSMNRAYSLSDVKSMANQGAVKPVVIDVACMNGKVAPNYLGTTLMKVQDPKNENGSFGTVAYYGGTVNISWHPPAVMARGIAYEHLEKKFKHLGEALLAGQLYLAGNWSNKEQVVDNFEWYHLQGDPGMNIAF